MSMFIFVGARGRGQLGGGLLRRGEGGLRDGEREEHEEQEVRILME